MLNEQSAPYAEYQESFRHLAAETDRLTGAFESWHLAMRRAEKAWEKLPPEWRALFHDPSRLFPMADLTVIAPLKTPPSAQPAAEVRH